MSTVVLSASARQNLSSLQATARLLDQAQGRLATGRRVNSALDSPTNFFTARALDSRAGDILADSNAEAANSQALSTRQSIAVSALSLANQSQQGMLRLLQ